MNERKLERLALHSCSRNATLQDKINEVFYKHQAAVIQMICIPMNINIIMSNQGG